MPGVVAGWPVAGRTMGTGVGVGVVTAAAFALWIVVVAASVPMVILVSAAGVAAPVGRTDSCSVITEPIGSFGRAWLSPLQASGRLAPVGSVTVTVCSESILI